MKKQCKWKKRLALPYRVEYDCKKGREILGDNGIMALRDQGSDSWTVTKRHYVLNKGQEYKDIKKFNNKENAVKFVKKYIKSNK